MRQELIAPGDLRDFTYRSLLPEDLKRGMPWMFAPLSPSLLESRWK
jgi:hypothetical protein